MCTTLVRDSAIKEEEDEPSALPIKEKVLWNFPNFTYHVHTRREMVHYRQEENPFVKILLTQNEYRLESNILLLRQQINFLC